MDSSKKIQQFLLSSAVPMGCSIILGIVFFPKFVFNPHNPAFQFVVTGVIASVFYNLMAFARPRQAYTGLIALFFVQLALDNNFDTALILRDVFYVASIGLAVVLFMKYFRARLRGGYFRYAITLAGLYPLIYILAMELDLFIIRTFHIGSIPSPFSLQFRTSWFLGDEVLLALLIGFAVGMGIAISEKLVTDALILRPDPEIENTDADSL